MVANRTQDDSRILSKKSLAALDRFRDEACVAAQRESEVETLTNELTERKRK